MEATIKRWGNSYAIRLTRRDLHRLGLKEGDAVDVAVRPLRRERMDLGGLPVFHDEATDVSERHDHYLYGARGSAADEGR